MNNTMPTVLVVDDEKSLRDFVRRNLEIRNFNVKTASNGLEALAILENKFYDVVFMDIQMPKMDGNEATKRIRADLPKERQPHIIAMTAHALEGDREKYLARAMDGYISKPIRVGALIEVLKAVKS